jgi:hypothetical protein
MRTLRDMPIFDAMLASGLKYLSKYLGILVLGV